MTNDERRTNPRQSIDLDAALSYNSLVLLECRTRDLSVEGAYVDTGGAILPQNAMIDLTLRLDVDGQTLQHRMPARVARIDEQGVGLNFRYADYSSFRALVELLNVAA